MCTSSFLFRRRRYDPSSKQVRAPDSVVGGGSGDRGSNRAPSTFGTAVRSSSRGDTSLVQGDRKRRPRATEKSITVDRGGMDSYNGVNRNLTSANSSGDFIVQVDGGVCRRPDVRSSGLDQGDTFEAHPGWEGNSPSPNTAETTEYRGRVQTGCTLATGSRVLDQLIGCRARRKVSRAHGGFFQNHYRFRRRG